MAARAVLFSALLGLGALLVAVWRGALFVSAGSAPPALLPQAPGEAKTAAPVQAALTRRPASSDGEPGSPSTRVTAGPARTPAHEAEPAPREEETTLADFRLLAADVLGEVRGQRERDHRAWLDGRRQQLDRVLEELEERLGLDAVQATSLSGELLAELDRSEEYQRLRASGATEPYLRELVARDRDEQVERLRSFLEPSQLQAYLQLPRRNDVIVLPPR